MKGIAKSLEQTVRLQPARAGRPEHANRGWLLLGTVESWQPQRPKPKKLRAKKPKPRKPETPTP